jgi:hypothetical protein
VGGQRRQGRAEEGVDFGEREGMGEGGGGGRGAGGLLQRGRERQGSRFSLVVGRKPEP